MLCLKIKNIVNLELWVYIKLENSTSTVLTIKLFDPVVNVEEENAVLAVLRSKFWASGAGTGSVSQFEKDFCSYTGSDFCLATSNGTSALHLALSLFDVENKEVILPSLSFVSTAHSVLYNCGIPVFVDVDPETLCVDTTKIESLVTEKTKAILPVHFGGMPCNIEELSRICDKHDLILVEDAAHAAGSEYLNQKIGSHGDAICFSFHPVKNLAMPTGGAVCLNNHDPKSELLLKSRRWCGISDRNGVSYDVKEMGWNHYMNEFSAAIGIEQLKKLDFMNKKRIEIAKKYCKEIEIENKMPFNDKCSYHLYWIRVNNREKFMKEMNDAGIETGIHYKPIHKMSFYDQKQKLPVTEKIAKEIVSIPIHPNLTEESVEFIIKTTNQLS